MDDNYMLLALAIKRTGRMCLGTVLECLSGLGRDLDAALGRDQRLDSLRVRFDFVFLFVFVSCSG